MEELVCIRLPDGSRSIANIVVQPSEDDRDIALRLARVVPSGSMLGIDGVKWKVLSSCQVSIVREQNDEVLPGQQWRPKDLRRKNVFTVARVLDGVIHTTDGRTIQQGRISRYQQVTS